MNLGLAEQGRICTLKFYGNRSQDWQFSRSQLVIKNRLNGEFNGIERSAALKKWIEPLARFIERRSPQCELTIPCEGHTKHHQAKCLGLRFTKMVFLWSSVSWGQKAADEPNPRPEVRQSDRRIPSVWTICIHRCLAPVTNTKHPSRPRHFVLILLIFVQYLK
ncbi:unnamed protein product [Nesidiocoris tenuis]|uniref:Uncharacterized protein n=1 Tax=Nesidiocoris tenuis TaxID=355587 RepID=A0A6H5H7U4_9HEMI|nr:unnamed protein product [Nesidiocoris tenuis]